MPHKDPEERRAYQARYHAERRKKHLEYLAGYRVSRRAKAQATSARYRGVRLAFLVRWKLAAGCIDCGYTQDADGLEFDHLVEGTGGRVMTAMSWSRLIAELTKCVVRCGTCHAIKSNRERRRRGGTQ